MKYRVSAILIIALAVIFLSLLRNVVNELYVVAPALKPLIFFMCLWYVFVNYKGIKIGIKLLWQDLTGKTR